MSESSGGAQTTLVLRLRVPAAGELRGVASELAVKIAEYLGTGGRDHKSIVTSLEDLARRVAPPPAEGDIEFDFRHSGGELLIAARSGTQSSELRFPLPA